MRIKEIIVVEGKDDERAVKQAADAEVIITSGYGITEETFRKIEFAMYSVLQWDINPGLPTDILIIKYCLR